MLAQIRKVDHEIMITSLFISPAFNPERNRLVILQKFFCEILGNVFLKLGNKNGNKINFEKDDYFSEILQQF